MRADQDRRKRQAVYAKKWYLENRTRILEGLRAKYVPRPERTPEQEAESRKKQSRTLRHTLKTLPQEKRRKIRRGLNAGWQKKQDDAAKREREKSWDVIRWRLDEVPFNEIVRRTGLNLKTVNHILRKAEIPKGKKYLMDRGLAFTRAAGTQIRNSLSMSYREFAALISSADVTVRPARVETWQTKSYRLDPPQARRCVALRDKLAEKLLAKEPVGRDSYDRACVLLALFPYLKAEYRLILEVLPALRAFLQENRTAGEKAIADFLMERGSKTFKRFLFWLPRLISVIDEERNAVAGSDPLRHVAVKILARTCPAPPKIVESVVHRGVRRPLSPRKMRELFRIHFPEESAAVGLLSSAPAPSTQSATFNADVKSTPRRRGPEKSLPENTVWFRDGRKVEELIPLHGQAEARHLVARETHRQYSTVEQYHKRYRSYVCSLIGKNPE